MSITAVNTTSRTRLRMPNPALAMLAALALAACGADPEDPPGSTGTSADASPDGDGQSPDVTQGDSGTTGSDASVDALADATPKGNPNVTLIREITFEQPAGTNGWSNPAEVVFDWSVHPVGRDNVPDALIRGAGGINIPDLVDGVAYRGKRSTLFTMQDWGQSSFRTDMEMVGDPSLSRLFPQGEIHVVGFAMRIEAPTYSGSFELYHQYHNSNPKKQGYGQVNNPALSLLRDSDTDLQIAVRANLPNGQREDSFFKLPNTVRAGQWVRWVFKTRFQNIDSGENALVEVYSAIGNEPLKLHVRVDDRPMGYAYENPAHNYEAIMFDMYGSPLDANAKMYLDEVRIVHGDHPASVVDPISWVGYQHPLNQVYDADLSSGAR